MSASSAGTLVVFSLFESFFWVLPGNLSIFHLAGKFAHNISQYSGAELFQIETDFSKTVKSPKKESGSGLVTSQKPQE
jgi:hypothetical protein